MSILLTRLRMLPRIVTQQHEIPEYLGKWVGQGKAFMGDFREVSNPPSRLLLFAQTYFSGQKLYTI